MKSSISLMVAAAVAALLLQGCAGTGGLTYANGAGPNATRAGSTWEATGPNSAITTTAARNQPDVNADTRDKFVAVAAAVKQEMKPGGRWQFVSSRERATVDRTFAAMGKLFDQYGSVDKMDADARAELLEDQSTINAILTKKDGDRIICKSEIPVGSHFPQKVCQTYAQMQAESQRTRQSLRNIQSNNPQLYHGGSKGPSGPTKGGGPR